MAIGRTSESYPYLALARRLGVEYAAVLAVADVLEEKNFVKLHEWDELDQTYLFGRHRLTVEQVSEIILEFGLERQRRCKVII